MLPLISVGTCIKFIFDIPRLAFLFPSSNTVYPKINCYDNSHYGLIFFLKMQIKKFLFPNPF